LSASNAYRNRAIPGSPRKATNPQPRVIQSRHPLREVSMPENQEMLRQSLLADLTALRENLDKTWAIVQ
ncbi:MAG: hypothetical protein WBW14_31340, partial [Candidatus Acidiferrum sp.]